MNTGEYTPHGLRSRCPAHFTHQLQLTAAPPDALSVTECGAAPERSCMLAPSEMAGETKHSSRLLRKLTSLHVVYTCTASAQICDHARVRTCIRRTDRTDLLRTALLPSRPTFPGPRTRLRRTIEELSSRSTARAEAAARKHR